MASKRRLQKARAAAKRRAEATEEVPAESGATPPPETDETFLIPHPHGGAPIALPKPDAQTSWVSRVMMAVLRVYKRYLSPVLGAHCRFTPTCSVYAMEAFKKYGFFRGAARSMGRLARCNPMCEGGYDPP